MDYEDVRDRLLRHWSHTGGPNEHLASELYHEDVVLEFPQSGEWFRGRDTITAWRSVYPARLQFEPRTVRGEGDTWIAEGQIRYDGGEPMLFVKIVSFRDGLVAHESIYITEPFPAPDSRTAYAESAALASTPGLPVVVEGGR